MAINVSLRNRPALIFKSNSVRVSLISCRDMQLCGTRSFSSSLLWILFIFLQCGLCGWPHQGFLKLKYIIAPCFVFVNVVFYYIKENFSLAHSVNTHESVVVQSLAAFGLMPSKHKSNYRIFCPSGTDAVWEESYSLGYH